MTSEAIIQANIRLALGQRDDVMLFRINVGKFRPIHGDQSRVIQSAPKGTPDLLGVVSCTLPAALVQSLRQEVSPETMLRLMDFLGKSRGRALAIEVKRATGRQSPEQAAFQKAWEARGGLYILARSVEDVLEKLP